jgi:hypothetical protein
MIISYTAFGNEIKFVDKKNGRCKFFCQFKDTVDVFGSFSEILRGNHREPDFKNWHMQCPGHRKRQGRFSSTWWPDEKKFSNFMDPVMLKNSVVNCMLYLGYGRDLFGVRIRSSICCSPHLVQGE